MTPDETERYIDRAVLDLRQQCQRATGDDVWGQKWVSELTDYLRAYQPDWRRRVRP